MADGVKVAEVPENATVPGMAVVPWVRVKAVAGVNGSSASLKVAVRVALTGTPVAELIGFVTITVGLVVSAGGGDPDPPAAEDPPPPPPQDCRRRAANRKEMTFHLRGMVHLWFC